MSGRWWALPRGHPFSLEEISPAGLDELFRTIDGLTVFRSRTSSSAWRLLTVWTATMDVLERHPGGSDPAPVSCLVLGAWCLVLGAFGAFHLALASAPHHGNLLPGK